MSFLYNARVSNYLFDLHREDLRLLDALAMNGQQFHVLRDNKAYRVEVVDADFAQKRFTLRINGREVQVGLRNRVERQIEELGLESQGQLLINEIRAPMPGLVLSISVEEGTPVKAGDPLVILEAMKMENVLTAPRDGEIAAILVKAGQTVNKMEVLVKLG